jgi:xylulose-5-phosphate/fructose-6-phosphate phosphoketolase
MKACIEAGLVDEVLAEELCAAWTWGAVEAGCEAVFATYEAFSPLTSTLIAQYAKQIHTRPDAGRPPLVVLLTSLGWANCPTHQNTDLVATVLARPIPKMRLICPIGANSAAERVQALIQSSDTIGIVVCSKQPLLNLPDPGSSAIQICLRDGPQYTATIVALGDVCITESVAAMTLAAKVGIGIRVIAIAELNRALARAPIEAPPPFEPSTIGAVWCAPSLVAPALWTNLGFSFPIFGYCERWGATAWETLRANSLDRNSLLRALSTRDLFPSTAFDSLEDQLRNQESQPIGGGVIPFDCPLLQETPLDTYMG